MGQEHILSSCAPSKAANFGVNDGDARCGAWSRTCCTAQEDTSYRLLRARESAIEINVFTLEGRESSNRCHRNLKAFTDPAGKQLTPPTWLSQDTNENSSQFLNHAQILRLSVQDSPRLHTIHLVSETGSHFCTSEQRQCHGTITVISNTLHSHHHRATCAKDRAITQVMAHKFSSSCSVDRRRIRTVWMPGLPSYPHQEVSSPSLRQRSDPHSSLGVGVSQSHGLLGV